MRRRPPRSTLTDTLFPYTSLFRSTRLVAGEPVWDSLAIAEYRAEQSPDKGLWPADPAARRVARCITAEMHAGFQALRNALSMDLSRLDPRREVGADVEADIGRILQIWRDCREGFGAGGDFLFGRACIADAFYAPVVTRFRSYGIELDDVGEAYVRTVTAWPAMREWTVAADEESEELGRAHV